MKEKLEELLQQAFDALVREQVVPADAQPAIAVTRTKDPAHGDFASNLAMLLAKPAKLPPRTVAERIVELLPECSDVDKVEIAGPGFLNFFVNHTATHSVVAAVLAAGEAYGRSNSGGGRSIQVEYVSANPTGPLHVGHGRGAAMGATLANMLAEVGYDVQREYYVNDAGRQMDILAASVWLRYLELCGETIDFPSNGYKGGYVHDIAAQLREQQGESLRHPAATVFAGVSEDASADGETGDKEAHIDDLVSRARELLGPEAYRLVFDRALDDILDDIRDDLGEFGVHYDNWFSERSLTDDVSLAIETLEQNGHLYEKEGARWFRSTQFGDEKDRVVVRENGNTTYFASDIAYILNKLNRGFERVLYVFGADHHGYVSRLKAACAALGHDPDKLEFILIQFAILYRGEERVQMSTRSGSFVTIRELRDEVGKDAARYFYVMRKYSQHLDFDLELAASNRNDNPVYYVQYAHARVCSVMRELTQRNLEHDQAQGLASLGLLTASHETELMASLAAWPEVVERAARDREPHQITSHLRKLANGLNTYYDAHRWLVDDAAMRDARLCLIIATRQVLANGLRLLDVSAPEVL